MTTRAEIEEWLTRGKEGNTHMVVVCDTFSWEDYPVFVTKGEDVHEVVAKYDGKNMQKVMEVYSYNHDIEAQLNQNRAFNFD